MTELIHYQPGKAFYDSFQGARGNTLAKLAITGEGEQRKSALADLYGLDPSLASQAQAQIGKNDEQDYSELVQSAKVMYSLKGRPEADMMWQRVAPKFSQKYGIQFNPTPQPSDWDAIEKIVQATGSGGKYTGAPVVVKTENGPRFARYSESGMEVTDFAPDDRYVMQTDGQGNVYGFNTRVNTLDPTGAGGRPQMPQVQAGADPMAGGLDRINQGVQVLKSNGVPVEKINEWADNEFAKLQGSVQQGVVEQAPPMATGGQARLEPKPQGQMTEYQAEMLALAKQREAQATADRKAKSDIANQKKGDAEQKRNEAVIMSVDDTLNTIDRLEKSPGYAELGTALGDIKLKTPLVRSDVKDANATLKTLAGQIALSTMANLKTLSASGATGFGALTAPELSLLQNSIATLQQEDVSNSQIVESIRVIKEKMAKIKQSAVGATSAPQGGGQAPVQVRNADDYNRLPAGTQYIDPTGKQRVKK